MTRTCASILPGIPNSLDGNLGVECRLATWRDHVLAHWQVRCGRLNRFRGVARFRRVPHQLFRDPRVQVITSFGYTLCMPYGDWLVPQALRGLLYEQQTLSNVLHKIVTPGGLVIDGGAHVGLYTCLFAERVGPKGKVIAFEPNARITNWLRKNLAYNFLTETVDVVVAALWNRTEEVSFQAPLHTSTAARIVGPGNGSMWSLPTSPTVVKAVSLDEWLVQSYGFIPAIMLLKLDLEGAEKEALEGASATIGSCRYIVLELNSGRSSPMERARIIATLSSLFDAYLVQEKDRSLIQYDEAESEKALNEAGWVNVLMERRGRIFEPSNGG